MVNSHLEHVLVEMDALPPIPEVFRKVLEFTRDGNSSRQDLIRYILLDQAIAEKNPLSGKFGIPGCGSKSFRFGSCGRSSRWQINPKNCHSVRGFGRFAKFNCRPRDDGGWILVSFRGNGISFKNFILENIRRGSWDGVRGRLALWYWKIGARQSHQTERSLIVLG
jgi:hypothetical protein